MSTIRDYLIGDIKKLNDEDINKLYKYVRTHLIANIDGLKDPLERSNNKQSTSCEQLYYGCAIDGASCDINCKKGVCRHGIQNTTGRGQNLK